MTSPDDGIQAQIRNIEERYGKAIGDWLELIRVTGLTKHNEVVAFLKTEHGMNHGAAHRVSLTARQASEPRPASVDGFVDGLYAGPKAGLRPIHDELIRTVTGLGADVSLVPKKGYLSLRRSKQFAMSGQRVMMGGSPGLFIAGRRMPSRCRWTMYTARTRGPHA